MSYYQGASLFTSSPLSAPPSSPRKKKRKQQVQSHAAYVRSAIAESSEGDDDEDEDDEATQRPVYAAAAAQTGNDTSNAENEYEVEAIISRKGGYNGKTLMYKVRWKGWGADADTWEPRSNISADDLIRAFEARKPRPVKRHKRTESKGATPYTIAHPPSSIYAAPSSAKQVSKPRRLTRDKEAKTYSWQELPYDADELVFPVSSLLCDAAWSKLRKRAERTASLPAGSRKLIVIHPATLVRLRTLTSSSLLNTYFRVALKEAVQLIRENQYAMLSNASFPTKSVFYDRAPYDILVGGEPYRLSWDAGIEEPDQEFFHLLATLQSLPQRLERHRRCTLLVRKMQPEMQQACAYFGIRLMDANSFLKNT